MSAPGPSVATDSRSAVAVDAGEGYDAVAAEDWDECVPPGSGVLKHGFLAAWERCELRNLATRPLTAHEDGSGQLVAACPAQFYDLDVPTSVGIPGMTGLAGTIRRAWGGFLFARLFEVSGPAPLSDPFLVRDPAQRSSRIGALIDEAVEEGNRGHAQLILVQDFSSADGAAGEELARRGFTCVSLPPAAAMAVPYDSFDDYLGAMRRRYRRNARDVLEQSGHLRVERRETFDELAAELARLWRVIYERAGEAKREILTPAFFRAVSDLEGSSVLVLRREDDSIAAFGLLLADEPWLYFLQCGFEEEVARTEGAYYRLMYEVVRFAIDHGLERVDLGITSLEPKLGIGGVAIPLHGWVKHTNPLLQPAISLLGPRMARPPEPKPRNVFKEPPVSAEELAAERTPTS